MSGGAAHLKCYDTSPLRGAHARKLLHAYVNTANQGAYKKPPAAACKCLPSHAGPRGENYPFLTQKERDIEPELDFFEARYFSSTQGRFTSTDPIYFQTMMAISGSLS